MKISIVSFLIVVLFACAEEIQIKRPEEKESQSYGTHPKNEFYKQELTNYRNKSLAPGSILLVDKPNEALWIGAVGKSNLAYQIDMKTTDQFRTGSITKMFTAVVMMKLVEQGKVSLEDTLAELLPQVSGRIPHAEKITVRHLLAHLSGIIDPPNESLRYQGDIINNPEVMYQLNVEETLKTYVYGKDLHFTPGTAYSYSNTNYWLLGLIAERVTEKKIQRIMEEMILEPLQMNDTYIEKRNDRNVVRGYAELYKDGILMDVSVWDRAEGDGEADGGMISTALDLQKFMQGLFNHELVSVETLNEMKKIQLPGCKTPYCEYGLGIEIWRTESGTAYGHNGGLVGIEANTLYYENTGTIIVLYKNEGRGSDKSMLDRVVK